ncbi:hypothetical protein ACWC3X_42605 [Streptomyces populi]
MWAAFAEYGWIDETMHLLAPTDPVDDACRRLMNRQLIVQKPRHRVAHAIRRGGRGRIRQAYREGRGRSARRSRSGHQRHGAVEHLLPGHRPAPGDRRPHGRHRSQGNSRDVARSMGRVQVLAGSSGLWRVVGSDGDEGEEPAFGTDAPPPCAPHELSPRCARPP